MSNPTASVVVLQEGTFELREQNGATVKGKVDMYLDDTHMPPSFEVLNYWTYMVLCSV